MRAYYFNPNELGEIVDWYDVESLTAIKNVVYASFDKQNVIKTYESLVKNKIERLEAEIEMFKKLIKDNQEFHNESN